MKAAELATEFCRGYSKVKFLEDAKTQSAVLHQLLIIGEAVKNLSDDFKTANPDVPWRLIAGMRDKVIHDYSDVDLDEVWKTVQSDVPVLAGHLNVIRFD